MSNDISRKKRPPNQRPKVWQDIVIQKPQVKIETPGKKGFKFPKFSKSSKINDPAITKKTRPHIKAKILPITIGILVVLIGVVIVFLQNAQVQHPQKVASEKKNDNTIIKTTKLETGTPTFTTITPGKQTAKWTKVSPQNSDPVYAYTDKIGSVAISVSQQLIPDSLKPNTPDKLEELARDFDADKKIAAGGTVIYIGTSAKGPQSVLLTKNDLLILIKSQSEIKNEDWVKYISSLE